MQRSSAIAEAKAALQRDVLSIARELLPGGRKEGNYYVWTNWRRGEKHGGSFKVWLRGLSPGAWKDYGGEDKGDILDLVCFARSCSRGEALAWAQDRCGLKRMSEADRAKFSATVERDRALQAEREKTAAEKRRLRANLMFSQAEPAIAGTLAEVYLSHRGIDLARLPHLEARWFRFLPSAEWWMGRVRDDLGRTIQEGPRFPALVSGFVDAEGKHRACHLTFLAPDGRGKAPVEKPKLIWPEHQGLVIRISKGADGLTPEEAAEHGVISTCIVGEGVEDGGSLAIGSPECRVWAAGSLAGLMALHDHACVSDWIVAKDNDWGKPQAAALFEKAIRRLRSFGKPVAVVSSRQGKDFNDQLRGVS